MTVTEIKKAIEELDKRKTALQKELKEAEKSEAALKYLHKAFKIELNGWQGIVEFTGYNSSYKSLTAISFSCMNNSTDWDEYNIGEIKDSRLTPIDDFKESVLKYLKEDFLMSLEDMNYKKGMSHTL